MSLQNWPLVLALNLIAFREARCFGATEQLDDVLPS